MVSTSTSPMSTASKPVAAARYPAAVSVLPVDAANERPSHRKRCNDRRSAGLIGLLLVNGIRRRIGVLRLGVLHLLVCVDHLWCERRVHLGRGADRIRARVRRHEPRLVELALIGERGRKEEECDHGFDGNAIDKSRPFL